MKMLIRFVIIYIEFRTKTMKGFIIFVTAQKAINNMEFLINAHLDHLVLAFCTLDKKLNNTTFYETPVILWREAEKRHVPFLLAVESEELRVAKWLLESSESTYSQNLPHLLSTQFGIDSVVTNRQFCKFYHDNYMNTYYESAENELDIFWKLDSHFYRLFSLLDLTDVVELACGHGRHVNQYINQANSITLVDISEKNIAFCKERFKGVDKIHYYRNNGYDLCELKNDSYTSLFSYDSMVHFELFDIYNYLIETQRILKKGGRALFHHSNLMLDPKQTFYQSFNIGGRTFMSKDLFAHICYQAGLNVLDQHIIDWSMPKMDCITIVEKS